MANQSGNVAVGVDRGKINANVGNKAVAKAGQRFLRMAMDIGSLCSGGRRITEFDVLMRGVRLYIDEQVARHPSLKPLVDERLRAFEGELRR